MIQQYKLNAVLLAYNDADKKIIERGRKRLEHMFDNLKVTFTSSHHDILFFLTGGSEAEAVTYLTKDQLQLLVACGKDNAYASATEVQAYAKSFGFETILVSLDEKRGIKIVKDFYKIRFALERIKGMKAGLIGEVSDWLVASYIKPELLNKKLGIIFQQIPWNTIDHFSDRKVNQSFLARYNHKNITGLNKASKVYELLREVIQTHHLDAITVECFPMAIKNHVTACLALSYLNDKNFPAGCEGDMVSLAGMILLNEITGNMPWMANLAGINGSRVLFAHCTAPTYLLSEFSIQTHFETGKGTAIRGYFKKDTVTIFRFDNKLSRAFLAVGKVIDHPAFPEACRTQILVKLNRDVIKPLKENPLGNHHLVLPGDYSGLLAMLIKVLRMRDAIPGEQS